jgi:glycosyltransferase involved in cell wall biosynthesis
VEYGHIYCCALLLLKTPFKERKSTLKISIVTISFNQADYLKKCIDSVLSQRFNDLEYIVVDPGSTDGSREIIESYGDRLIKVFEKDNGAADGLNKGFSRATGDIFGFINSDDELLPGALEKVANAFRTNSQTGAISGCGYFVDASGAFIKSITPSKFTAWRYAYGAVSVFQQGTFFRSEWFKKAGGFNTENRTCWDGELFLHMSLAGARFNTIGEELAIFRLHDASITGSGRLNELYARDADRIFRSALKRPRSERDRYIAILAKLRKWLFEPSWLIRRIARLR